MIGYVSVGTNDFKRALAFYDTLMTAGRKACDGLRDIRCLETRRRQARLRARMPFNKKPATIGNGSMVAFQVDKPEQVDSLYKKAMALGATDEGPPGDRGDNYYGAYFRDLDGNKLNFHCWT